MNNCYNMSTTLKPSGTLNSINYTISITSHGPTMILTLFQTVTLIYSSSANRNSRVSSQLSTLASQPLGTQTYICVYLLLCICVYLCEIEFTMPLRIKQRLLLSELAASNILFSDSLTVDKYHLIASWEIRWRKKTTISPSLYLSTNDYFFLFVSILRQERSDTLHDNGLNISICYQRSWIYPVIVSFNCPSPFRKI